ncbi:MAG: type II toxin-antitoxin system HicB family antitoxin [Candidatus Paceibacterota bacterium]
MDKKIAIKTKMGTYDAVFSPNTPQRGYTVTVPKLKGIVTFGDTLAEAKENATEAIELHCKTLLSEGVAYVTPQIRSHAS